MGTIFILPCDRRPRLYHATVHPSLRRLRWVVGGSIELVPLWTRWGALPCVAYCNEEGKLNNLPVNWVATDTWYRSVGRHMQDVLVGHVIVIVGLSEDTREEWREK